MNMTFDLEPVYDSRKSFYHKARVEVRGNEMFLYSYNTLVSTCKDGVVTHLGKWSTTTSRHQKEFEKQFAEPYKNVDMIQLLSQENAV